MKNLIQRHRQLIIGVVVGALAIALITSIVVEKRLGNLQNQIELSINNSNLELKALASSIARGEANEVAARVVSDCTVIEQAQFDNRLGKLDAGLSLSELNELDTLFSRCAPVSVIKRSAMVVQFEAELDKLKLLVEQREQLGKFDETIYQVTIWDELLATEKQITKLSFDSVSLQYEIIRQLIAGLKVDSEPANELKNKGQLIRTDLIKLVEEATQLREGLK